MVGGFVPVANGQINTNRHPIFNSQKYSKEEIKELIVICVHNYGITTLNLDKATHSLHLLKLSIKLAIALLGKQHTLTVKCQRRLQILLNDKVIDKTLKK